MDEIENTYARLFLGKAAEFALACDVLTTAGIVSARKGTPFMDEMVPLLAEKVAYVDAGLAV